MYKRFTVSLENKLKLYEYSSKKGASLKDIVVDIVKRFLSELDDEGRIKLVRENKEMIRVSDTFAVYLGDELNKRLNVWLVNNGLKSHELMNSLVNDWRKRNEQ